MTTAEIGKHWGKIDSDKIEIVSMLESDLDEALNLLDKAYFPYESICIGCELNLPENSQARSEFRELCRLTAADGISLVAKDASNKKIVGAVFNKIQCLPAENEQPFYTKYRNENCRTTQSQCAIDFMIDIDAECDIFKLYNLNCVVELTFLGTLREYRRRGIATALERYTIDWTRELSKGIGSDQLPMHVRGKRPQAVTAIYSSKYSRKAGETNDSIVLNSVPHDRYSFNGKTFAERINNPIHSHSDHVIHLL